MKGFRTKLVLAVAAVSAFAVGIATVAVADEGSSIREFLSGYEEVPALSTPMEGSFRATIDRQDEEIRYQLTYSDAETPVLQSHIHFENHTNNGPISVFLCTNLGNGPPQGVQACPPDGGTITGTIVPADVSASAASAGAVANGLGVGEFDELVRAIRAGATYVNVHTMARPGGEIRAQLERGNDD